MIKIDFKPTRPILRQFGWIGLFGFPLIAAVMLFQWLAWQPNLAVYILFGLGAISGLLAMVAPRALLPIYVVMMLIAIPIGFVISTVLLRLIYYLLFTPMALWFRIRGRDTMNRRLDPDRDSYWQDHRDISRPRTPSSYLRLY
ncbi:MAG: hypothetical protein VX951_03280 [Planctomycetota bacterium]|nr:hypothetical protein [Planctomycetota bacterium]